MSSRVANVVHRKTLNQSAVLLLTLSRGNRCDFDRYRVSHMQQDRLFSILYPSLPMDEDWSRMARWRLLHSHGVAFPGHVFEIGAIS